MIRTYGTKQPGVFLQAVLALLFLTSCAHVEEKMRLEDMFPLTVRQAVVVTTDGWESVAAALNVYERDRSGPPWVLAGKAAPVVVGRNGLAWGAGLHPSGMDDAPAKREGDGKAPAGVFSLGAAFGYASPGDMAWIRMPYHQATPDLLCVDDAASVQYNRLVDTRKIPCDWKSAEDMRRTDEQYRLGLVVEHNVSPLRPGGGSCIFLHIWSGPDTGTAGCTAMAPEAMEGLLRWLDPASRPVLVQLPRNVYERYRQAWGLP